MNKVHVFFLGLLLSLNTSSVLAQNWAPIALTGQTNYRINEPDSLPFTTYSVASFVPEQMSAPFRTIKVDSTKQVNGLNNYFFNDVSFISGNNVYAHQASFLERKMVDGGAGVYHFYDPDSVTLHTQANLNDSWVFSSNPQNTATVTNIIQDSVLGQMDSIKVIRLSMGDSILLSKNHGIVYFSDTSDVHYTLAGIEYTPTNFIGTQIPNIYNTYAYEVGDVLVFDFESSGITVNVDERIKYTVMSKTSTNYVFQKDYYRSVNNSSSGSQTVTTSVTTTSILPFYSNDESIANGELLSFSFAQQLGVITEDSLGRLYKLVVPLSLSNYNQTAAVYYTGSFLSSQVFTPGLGSVYNEGTGMQSIYNHALVAYIKDGVLVGDTTTLSFVPIKKIETLPVEVTVFPQPVNAFMNLELASKGMDLGTGLVELFNLEGKLVHQEAYRGENQLRINTAAIEQGMFVLKITTNKIHATKKIVIAH